jgi:RNA polymerase sigma factor (sigma-70 family)
MGKPFGLCTLTRNDYIPVTPEELGVDFTDYLKRLAFNFSKKSVRQSFLTADDYGQAAYIGVMRARKTYSPDRGMVWKSYAANKAYQEMLVARRENSSFSRVHQKQMKRTGERIPQTVDFSEIDPKHAKFPNRFPINPHAEVWAWVSCKLSPKLSQIVKLYFKDEWTLIRIAKKLGLSESRICQLVKRAVRILKKHRHSYAG